MNNMSNIPFIYARAQVKALHQIAKNITEIAPDSTG